MPTFAWAQNKTTRLNAPNVVEISPRLVTSGQPSAASLGELGSQGFKAVIYLAPLSVPDAIRDEPLILERQRIEFINIPIRFNNPTEADFEQFSRTLQSFGDGKVLVHCQVNMRASSMVFLYRVLVAKESPDKAYESVSKVWSPDGPWKQLMVSQLRKNGIAFEIY